MNSFHLFIEKLSNRLQKPLPDVKSYSNMSALPQLEKPLPPSPQLQNAKKAAVAILLYPKNEIIHTVLIQRNAYEGVHSNQMAFPGGRLDSETESFEAAALRETEEEIGVPRSSIHFLGNLSPIFIAASGSLVQPVAAYVQYLPKFVRQESEVASIVEIELNYLRQPEIVKQKDIIVRGFKLPQVPYYDVNSHTVWGATARILSEFLYIIDEVDPKS